MNPAPTGRYDPADDPVSTGRYDEHGRFVPYRDAADPAPTDALLALLDARCSATTGAWSAAQHRHGRHTDYELILRARNEMRRLLAADPAPTGVIEDTWEGEIESTRLDVHGRNVTHLGIALDAVADVPTGLRVRVVAADPAPTDPLRDALARIDLAGVRRLIDTQSLPADMHPWRTRMVHDIDRLIEAVATEEPTP